MLTRLMSVWQHTSSPLTSTFVPEREIFWHRASSVSLILQLTRWRFGVNQLQLKVRCCGGLSIKCDASLQDPASKAPFEF